MKKLNDVFFSMLTTVILLVIFGASIGYACGKNQQQNYTGSHRKENIGQFFHLKSEYVGISTKSDGFEFIPQEPE